MFFFLIQTEQGDVFKVTLETDEDVVSTCTYDSHTQSEQFHHVKGLLLWF